METVTCVCGTPVEGLTTDALFDALRKHCDEAHAELKIPDHRLCDLIRRSRELNAWDGQRLLLPGDVEIHELTPERRQDFLDYFDREAFIDNLAWASCYCYFYQFAGTNEEWQERESSENRAAKAASIADGTASGFLAYAGGKVVGWCHAAPRGTLPMLDEGPTEEDGERIAAVVCFNISPRYRQQGLAGALLGTAAATFAAKGYTVIEGYPRREFKTAAQSYHGPLSLFKAAGFDETGEERDGMVVVRKRFVE